MQAGLRAWERPNLGSESPGAGLGGRRGGRLRVTYCLLPYYLPRLLLKPRYLAGKLLVPKQQEGRESYSAFHQRPLGLAPLWLAA